jgi:hypothetical protein
MSVLRVNSITNRDNNGGPVISGLTTIGVQTSTVSIGVTDLYVEQITFGQTGIATGAVSIGVTDIYVSGTAFGNVTGNVTGNLTGEVDAAAFDTNPSGVVVTGIVTATSYRGDGSQLTGLPQQGVGINSAGTNIGYGITTLNFIGTGNTFAVTGTTVDISIAGGGGGGVGTAINYADNTSSPFSYINASVTVTQDIVLDTLNAGDTDSYIVVQEPTLIVASGIGVTVGAGKTLISDLFQLDGL